MSKFNRKGFTTIRARDSKTGAIFNAPVSVNGGLAKIAASRLKQSNRINKQAFREFKAQMREAKKALPLEMRSKVNWSEVQLQPIEQQQEQIA